MSKRGSICDVKAKVNYPEHLRQLNDMLDFIYEDGFWDDWDSLGLDHERDLWAIEVMLTSQPAAGAVIPGTGCLRKLRWGRDDKGKRGGLRIVYMYIPEIFIVYVFLVYGKSEKDDLSESGKKQLSKLASSIRARLLNRYLRKRARQDGENDKV